MRLTIAVDTRGASPAELRREMPFAMAFAINRTAEEVLLAQKAVAKRGLIIRQPQFLDAVFRLRRRASARDYTTLRGPETTWGLQASDFRGRASVFLDHEDGGLRVGTGTRSGFLYVPTYGTTLRPTIRSQLGRAWYPKALGLADRRAIDGSLIAGGERTKKRRGSTRGARAQVKAFVIRDPRNGAPKYIARRKGPRRMSGTRDVNLEILFTLHQRRAIRPRLQFAKTARDVAPERLGVNVNGMLAWALDRARQRSARAGERQTRLDLFGPAGLQRRAGWRLSARGVR